MTDLFGNANYSNAQFSTDGRHRLLLSRIWDFSKPLVMFIGLNPSTANATADDPTIRRVKSFAKAWGYGGVYMMNLFTFISTDPKQLDIKNGNHETANDLLKAFGSECKMIVFAWGNFNVHGRDNEIKQMFPDAFALQVNKNGSPKHPLYVAGDAIPVKYN